MAGIAERRVTAAAKSATNRMPFSWPRVDGLLATKSWAERECGHGGSGLILAMC